MEDDMDKRMVMGKDSGENLLLCGRRGIPSGGRVKSDDLFKLFIVHSLHAVVAMKLYIVLMIGEMENEVSKEAEGQTGDNGKRAEVRLVLCFFFEQPHGISSLPAELVF